MSATTSVLRLALFAAACGAMKLAAQAQADFSELPSLVPDSEPGAFLLSWHGQLGRTYFLQFSQDLVNWQYLPSIEVGVSELGVYRFRSASPACFARLQYVDRTAADYYGADFDGDGVGNWVEVQRGLNPLVADLDSDRDGMPDAWEFAHGLDPNNPADSTDDSDGDGVRAKDELTFGLDPRSADAGAASGGCSVFAYTANDELSGYSSPSGISTSYAPDAEGNVQP